MKFNGPAERHIHHTLAYWALNGLRKIRRLLTHSQGSLPMMHQASILFTFMVLVMGGVWLAMVELGGPEPAADAPVAQVAMIDAQPVAFAN